MVSIYIFLYIAWISQEVNLADIFNSFFKSAGALFTLFREVSEWLIAVKLSFSPTNWSDSFAVLIMTPSSSIESTILHITGRFCA